VSGDTIFGGPPASFLILTMGLFGPAAWMTGQALARNWRPVAQLPLYVLLLAAADRFLLYALFGASLLSPSGYVVAVIVLLAAAGASFRITRAARMVAQYPWLYERAGLFGWRARPPSDAAAMVGSDTSERSSP
jgi:hypothetical protein